MNCDHYAAEADFYNFFQTKSRQVQKWTFINVRFSFWQNTFHKKKLSRDGQIFLTRYHFAL